MAVTLGLGAVHQRSTRISIIESIQLVTCPRCWAPPGDPCAVPCGVAAAGPASRRTHVSRWDFAMRENHDPGDEDRS